MTFTILHLNYLSVLVVTMVGFLFGWLWYSPVLFAKAWRTELNLTDEKMKEIARDGMGKYLLKGFIFTLFSTFGLAVLLRTNSPTTWLHGATFGGFIGVFAPGMRLLNAGVWERRSCKLQAIVVGHEILLFALQGAILAEWR